MLGSFHPSNHCPPTCLCVQDAHEFLTTVLYQIRKLSPMLQQIAASRGKRYICPVEDHLLFKMQTIRTCRSCGSQTKHTENFTHLSLDLVPRGSIEDMLDMHLMETELNYKCDCGNHKSCQHSSFLSLPRVLMLQLKRFFYTPFLTVRKLQSSIQVFKQLLLTSNQACGWYTLVSVISHLGDNADRGHYLSEGVNPDAEMDGSEDCWFTYDDSDVRLTTRDCVCQLRDESAYILFYHREL
ncbi:ubiquitin carboxyl-terminal hydrolase 37-like [Nelusetta ayraudi]|uniref:ubiquitin carboxyl-terminal hydrolase 37-like n=1 Tax=Nelusetta ayraudi TaxID=303726 RepID=UPI003F7175EF